MTVPPAFRPAFRLILLIITALSAKAERWNGWNGEIEPGVRACAHAHSILLQKKRSTVPLSQFISKKKSKSGGTVGGTEAERSKKAFRPAENARTYINTRDPQGGAQ